MRNPREYVQEMAEEVLSGVRPDMASLAYNDQFHADVKRMAATVGLDADSMPFKATLLLASDLLDHLAGCLEMTDEVDKEIGSAYISDAADRLRTLSLWGEQCNQDCLDLRNK